MLTRPQVADLVDHTILRPDATTSDVARHVEEAARLGVYAVCISPNFLPASVPEPVKVATVCGFPSGAHSPEAKAAEAAHAASHGADEIDMVVNLGWARSGWYEDIQAEISTVRNAAPNALLKVIIESALLSDEQIVAVCEAAERARADYVKTSTGFHPAGGASIDAVALMAKTVGGRLGVKASGGIRDTATATAMIAAGATRLGTSGTASVLAGFPEA
ncbi:deoxyribose-phosphate aldolase [Saccharopolyspora shandongensis]|uniref:deoxyribose-phosphate aldolase n=1 Tax=Saccharopolyspora shandongensis TaxID=418495 RepID=UPI0033DCEDBC